MRKGKALCVCSRRISPPDSDWRPTDHMGSRDEEPGGRASEALIAMPEPHLKIKHRYDTSNSGLPLG